MLFVQDATTPATVVTQSTTATLEPTATVPVDATTIAPPVIVPAADAASEAVSDAKADSKVDVNSEVNLEAKAATKPEVLTITKTEAVTTPLAPKASSDAFSLWMWLPLIIATGLWLYLRGRNQAAQRTKAEALLANASKKSKKSARSQTAEFRADETSDLVSNVTGERTSKGNSKKNKKDRLQQKKKQQANSGATTGKANSIAASAASGIESAMSLSEKGSDPLRRGQKLNGNDSPPKGQTPFRTGSNATESTAVKAAASAMVSTTERKSVVPIGQPAKAIFEPLRKVAVTTRDENAVADVEVDESDEQEFAPSRKRRPSPPPPVITTPAKVSSGRFEKLNLPPANAGLGSASANRWPAEAARPETPVLTPQPITSPVANSTNVQPKKTIAPSPVTARGLGAFVKVAKTTEAADSTVNDSAETQSESSST